MVAKTNLDGSVVYESPTNGRNQPVNIEAAPLSSAEKDQLDQCEGVIQMKLKAFLEVGLALLQINRDRLYRAQYRSFGEYCRIRWDMSRVHAFRLLKAAEVHELLLPVGNIPLPENEAQIRPLTALPANKIKSIWKRAIKKAAPGKVTAKLVRLVISESEGTQRSHSVDDRLEWQHQVNGLLQKARLANERAKLHEVSEILERIRVVLDVEIAREARSCEAE
jgi:hypothetical protein